MKTVLALVLFSVLALGAAAEPMKLTNRQGDELLGALQKVGLGLGGQNTMTVVRDTNALRPLMEAYAAGVQAEFKNRKINAATKTDSSEWLGYVTAAEKLGDQPITVELTRLTLTPEEVDRIAATTPPVVLSTVLLRLEAKSAK